MARRPGGRLPALLLGGQALPLTPAVARRTRQTQRFRSSKSASEAVAADHDPARPPLRVGLAQWCAVPGRSGPQPGGRRRADRSGGRGGLPAGRPARAVGRAATTRTRSRPTCAAMRGAARRPARRAAVGRSRAEHELWLAAGSVPERDADGRIYNTLAVLRPHGPARRLPSQVPPLPPRRRGSRVRGRGRADGLRLRAGARRSSGSRSASTATSPRPGARCARPARGWCCSRPRTSTAPRHWWDRLYPARRAGQRPVVGARQPDRRGLLRRQPGHLAARRDRRRGAALDGSGAVPEPELLVVDIELADGPGAGRRRGRIAVRRTGWPTRPVQIERRRIL